MISLHSISQTLIPCLFNLQSNIVRKICFLFLPFASFSVNAQSVQDVDLPFLGILKHYDATEIGSSNWIIGCETLDRDYTDYDQYKSFLVPLGIERIRLQAGWAKTEKEKGIYAWNWLDHIIEDATNRGLKPWLQLSYGNPIYNGGGGMNLAAGMPHSTEALLAWDNWVSAIVARYKSKVKDWEIWNEPNFGDNSYNTPEKSAALNIRTIDIIKSIQPEAKVSGLAMGHIDLEYADEFFEILKNAERLDKFDNMTYHDYMYNPDAHYSKVMNLKSILEKYNEVISLRQGENGAPSAGQLGGAISDYDWTELSQAKWITRRMLGDLGHNIETSIFTIIDIPYMGGPISKLNVKGLIQSDSSKQPGRPKLAYSAVQNVVSVLNSKLERIDEIHETHNPDLIPDNQDIVLVNKSTDRSFAIYGFRNKETNLQVFTIWNKEGIPGNETNRQVCDFIFTNANFRQPVYVDIISGEVFSIPKANWRTDKNKFYFKKIPIYDGPILIADKSLIVTVE